MRAGVWKCGLWHVWKIKGGLFGSSFGGFSLWVLLVLGWLLWVFLVFFSRGGGEVLAWEAALRILSCEIRERLLEMWIFESLFSQV